MKKKVRCVFYLNRRLYRVLEDIMPLFMDLEADNPKRGAMRDALEFILQSYMESEDYQKKLDVIKSIRYKLFLHLTKRQQEQAES